jgi:transcriptional regulator with XRE-family HTH domain
MLAASLNALGVGTTIPLISQTVRRNAIGDCHNLCGAFDFVQTDNAGMDSDKNGGPNHLKAWRTFRGQTLEQLAVAVDTNANMIGYLESGERGLSAKWLRRLAPALKTTPGMLLDHDPYALDSDVIDIWVNADERQRLQITEVARTLARTASND